MVVRLRELAICEFFSTLRVDTEPSVLTMFNTCPCTGFGLPGKISTNFTELFDVEVDVVAGTVKDLAEADCILICCIP